jgi:predicted heme/steroid binding protein/uncharacterized membrane protein
MKEFDLKTLAQFDGKNGKPAYVAFQGKVYDVTSSKRWPGGQHMKRHESGKDLTLEILAAPHGPEMLERVPQAGILVKEEKAAERPMPEFLAKLITQFPILRRHPHPMVVHFPIAFTFATVLFNLLYLITGIRSFEVTAFHCLGGAILFIPVGMITGWFTWWLNYLSRPMRPVTIKIRFSSLLWAVAILTFIWRIAVPDILGSLSARSILYLLLNFSFIPLVTVIGWYGAQLTFPLGKD